MKTDHSRLGHGWIMTCIVLCEISLRWHHNRHDNVSNHQPHDCLLNRLFIGRSKKTSKLRVAGLCMGNSLGTGEFPAQMASNTENVSIWWRHHVSSYLCLVHIDCVIRHLDKKIHPKFHMNNKFCLLARYQLHWLDTVFQVSCLLF